MTRKDYDHTSTPSVFNQVVPVVVSFLKEQGFSSLKADAPGFSIPAKVKWDEEHEGVVPHITGEYEGCIYVFEIETSVLANPEKKEDRWRLLSVFAKRNQGIFYLVVPENKANHLQDVVNDLNVDPSFLKLSGLNV